MFFGDVSNAVMVIFYRDGYRGLKMLDFSPLFFYILIKLRIDSIYFWRAFAKLT
jgi:hypothetical protein